MKIRIVSLLMLASAALLPAQDIVVDAPSFIPHTDADETPPPPVPLVGGEIDEAVPPVANPGEESAEEPTLDLGATEDGYIIKDASLNDIFQFLARSAGRQYFHNARIAGPEFTVTGHLNDGNPLQQMEELAFMYGLSLHMKGDTIYALTQAQLAQLPSSEFHYQLRYLRPSDMEQIKELVRPMLTPGSGIVNFEPKTNTIIIVDTAHRIEAARNLLHNVDKAKGQIIVETKILRVNTTVAERLGVNWTETLGAQGLPLGIARDLNSVFGLESLGLGGVGGANPNLVLDPLTAAGVLRALSEGGIAQQISNPTLITEDNEQATISIIDRVPIITTSTTQTTTGGNPTVTEEVRYKIDAGDQSIDQSPDSHREIGISLVVTPTLLPDGTIRMRMRPRNAQITGKVEGIPVAGIRNEYPLVTESMIEALARVPDGHSLVVGGFYGEVKTDRNNKVPLLGDIPMINFFFKSSETVKEKTSLVFIVTPKSYDPRSGVANSNASASVRGTTTLTQDSTWIDDDNPGPAHEPNLRRTLRGLQPQQAPYYPRTDEGPSSSRDSASKEPASPDPKRPRFGRGSRRF